MMGWAGVLQALHATPLVAGLLPRGDSGALLLGFCHWGCIDTEAGSAWIQCEVSDCLFVCLQCL